MRTKIFGTQTLKLDGIKALPLWRGIYGLIGIILGWMLIAEVIGRTSLGYYLPPPSVGADSFEFDTKVYYLEQSVRQHGSLDCLIVGDSMVNDGPDPRLIEEAYRAQTGSSIQCFNFGLPAMFLETSGQLAQALVNRFHPKLLILILSARDFENAVDFPIRYVASSDWSQQNLGKTSVRGWAVNSLYGYRYYLSFRYWLTPLNREKFADTWHTITREGFTPVYGFGEERKVPDSGIPFQRTNASAQKGFDELLQLKRAGVNLLIIDAPLRPDLYATLHENYFQPYINYMQTTLAENGIPFWLTKDLSDSIPADGWYDLQHVNEKGVPLLSAWMGTQLAQNYPPEFFK